MNYWIFKSEPDEYGIDDLAAENDQTARWDGIRNYQARNNLRDKVAVGDKVFFYHSSCRNIGIAGTALVVKAAYPDPAQYEASNKYYDSKATPEQPRWFCVDIKLERKFDRVIPVKMLKSNAGTASLEIFRQSRLSVAPVTRQQWDAVQGLAEALAVAD